MVCLSVYIFTSYLIENVQQKLGVVACLLQGYGILRVSSFAITPSTSSGDGSLDNT